MLGRRLAGQGWADDLAEPSQMGRPPGGPARIADIVAQQEGFEPVLGGLEIPMASSRARLRSRMASSSTVGDIDRREIARAPQPASGTASRGRF